VQCVPPGGCHICNRGEEVKRHLVIQNAKVGHSLVILFIRFLVKVLELLEVLPLFDERVKCWRVLTSAQPTAR
jgi:hypothetical protein